MEHRALVHLLCVLGVFHKGLTDLIRTQPTVMAAVGDEAILNCELLQSKDVVQVIWWKILPNGMKALISQHKKYGQDVNHAFRDKVEFTDAGLQSSSIIIRNVTEQDEGCYCCLFNIDPGDDLNATTCLQLFVRVLSGPQKQSADGLHCAVSDVEMQEHYDEFFEEVFTEMEEKYGEVEEMNVCDNLGDHLVGNVYVKFRREEDAEKAVMDLNNRWFNGQPIHAELSPVTDFREACCRQYEMGECTRGGFCNFMHLKPISRELRRELYGRRRKRHRSRSRSRERRSRSRDRRRDRERRRSRDRERSGRF
ncbi:uncharacterized protein [Pagrus major]